MTQPTVEPKAQNPTTPPGTPACDTACDTDTAAGIEAILLSVDKAVGWTKLAAGVGLLGQDETPTDEAKRAIERAIETLNQTYEATGRSFTIEAVAGGYRLMTRPRYASVVAAFHRSRAPTKLSRAALETLAIVAYKQPITRASLEAIRGVGCGEVLRSLIERKLVTITGRAEELGRPMLYGTTRHFLDTFGLASIKDLPTSGELGPVS